MCWCEEGEGGKGTKGSFMVTPSLGPTLVQGDWSCQQPPCHCEHRHTDCPEASSLGGLAKMIETDVVSRSICLKPILSITITKGVALEAATFPKLLPDVFLPCCTMFMPQPSKNEGLTGWSILPHGYWGLMVQPHRPAPQCLPPSLIPKAGSWSVPTIWV